MVLNVTFVYGKPGSQGWPVPRPKYSTAEDLTVGAGATSSAACPADCNMVRLSASEACRVDIAAVPTAAATDMMLHAGTVEYIECKVGDKVGTL